MKKIIGFHYPVGKRILLIPLFSIFIFSLSYATQPSIPSLKMEMSIIHDGNWEVGKENTVTFKFKPLEDVPHKLKHPDEAELYLGSGLVLVSGARNWSDFLKKGKEESVSLILNPTKPGKLVVSIAVRSCLSAIRSEAEVAKLKQERDKMLESSPELKKKGVGLAKIPTKSFEYYNGKSAVIEIGGQVAQDTTFQEIKGAKIRNYDNFPPPRIKDVIPTADSIKKIRKEVPKDSSKAENLQSSDAFNITGRFRYVNNFGIIDATNS